MRFDFLVLWFFLLLPMFYKFSFWLYVFQLKEYRLDRFKEYINTIQWKNALFNFWLFSEIPLFILFLFYLFNNPLEIFLANTLLYLLILENIFVLWKIFRRNFIKPKITSRLLVTIFIIFLLLLGLILSINFYLFIFINLIITPLIIIISIFLSLPIVNYKKRKQINRAILKSNSIKWPIKVGITWSYWKTSVKEYLSQILSNSHRVLSTPENINTEMWVSDLIIKKLKNSYDFFIAEMWAYKIGEIKTLWNIVNHKYWFLTAIWNQHLWLFWSIENIIKAKSEIEEKVRKNWWKLYINWDNENIRKTIFSEEINLVKYWLKDDCDARSEIIELKNWKTIFNFNYNNKISNFTTNLIWTHNIVNLTWIIAFCLDIWLTKTKISEVIERLELPKNTLEIIEKDKNILINDSYNLSEWWLFAWLDILNSYPKDYNKILIIDDILELWKNAKKIHTEIWEKIAKNKSINNILFVWVNYKKEFISWLIKWWFKKENIIKDIYSIKGENIILFEWRKTQLLFNSLKWEK